MSKNKIKNLGQLVCTASIATAIEEDPEFQTEINIIFENYVKGDWGDTCEENCKLNDEACKIRAIS